VKDLKEMKLNYMRILDLLKGVMVALLAGAMFSCDPWSGHTDLNDPDLDKTVLSVLKEQPDLGTFVRILEKTGYDTILVRSQAYTIFAPTDAAWNGVDTSDLQLMRSFVKNHIAYQSMTMSGGSFRSDKVRMINGKFLNLNGSTIEGYAIEKSNILAGNGVIHSIKNVITPKMNIWEFINSPENIDNEQVKFLNSNKKKTMDIENSYMLYLDGFGRPVYDTAWIETNDWLSKYALNNEDSTYTFLLIDNSSLEKLKAKYKPYFSVYRTAYNTELSVMESAFLPDSTEKHITEEIVRDMILKPIKIEGDQVVLSVDGVKVNILAKDIDQAYTASNGMVYVLSDVSVKMYNNKVKEIILEGENYAYSNVASTIISKRFKDWARGNFDVVLSGRDASNHYALSSQSTAFYTNVMNSYLAYTPTLNSVPYEVYWMSYDDLTGHITDSVIVPQKLFFSNPGAPSLNYGSAGAITNNFLDTVVFIGQNRAGVHAETRLEMWSTSSVQRIGKQKLASHADYEVDKLPCYSFGKGTLWVANNAFSTSGTTGGSIFLDYIRLVPVVKPED
jgi:uncharacterized surface protein with fasciclin (FAS1) repeats